MLEERLIELLMTLDGSWQKKNVTYPYRDNNQNKLISHNEYERLSESKDFKNIEECTHVLGIDKHRVTYQEYDKLARDNKLKYTKLYLQRKNGFEEITHKEFEELQRKDKHKTIFELTGFDKYKIDHDEYNNLNSESQAKYIYFEYKGKKLNLSQYRTLEDIEKDECIYTIGLKYDKKKVKKDVLVQQLTLKLNSILPELEGDPVIQIGTTVHRYGDPDCCFKHIITLDTCDDIEDAVVWSYESEKEVLLAWRHLINMLDPDVITGYNIFGFDLPFMYERSEELNIMRQFCQIGRVRGKVCEFASKKLSSSALGDNILQYIDMDGVVYIDLMKLVQKDHNLESYKLDFCIFEFYERKN